MDSAHHIWCPLCCQKIESLPDGAEMTPTIGELGVDDKPEKDEGITTVMAILVKGKREYLYQSQYILRVLVFYLILARSFAISRRRPLSAISRPGRAGAFSALSR